MGLFDEHIDVVFDRLGEDATYTPSGGAAKTVKVMPKRADQVNDFGETRVVSASAVFDVRVSEVATPATGDTIAFGGTTYVIKGDPRREDTRRLIWTLETRPQ